MKKTLTIFASALLSACSGLTGGGSPEVADVLIYGDTSAAVITAIQSAKEGKTAIIVAPQKHLGAMTTSGLGETDAGKSYSIGGLSREFYHRIWLEYSKPEAWKVEKRANFAKSRKGAIDDINQLMWKFEPKVATRVFENWLAEYPDKITVVRCEKLDRSGSGVVKKDGKILSIKTLSGRTFAGKMFVDATFEGDLMAAAGCKYIVGREGNSQYSETLNGYRKTMKYNGHHFRAKTDPYKIEGDKSSGLLPHVSDQKEPECGSADKRVQAYNFRLCLTTDSANGVEIQKPDGYNPAEFELFVRSCKASFSDGVPFGKLFPMIISAIPNRKTDCNNRGAVSTDMIGANYAYPEASYEERERIVEAHKNYTLRLLYFWQNDPNVDEKMRTTIRRYKLAKDEFEDNCNFPFNLYVREARRMVGDYVMTEHNCRNAIETPQPVGMGSYTLDSHNTSRCVRDGYVQNEGDTQVWLPEPYKIAYGAIVPRRSDCLNLFVPVACSASHIAYGSIRMEPVFMILGQSSATAAALAIDSNCSVQDTDYGKLSAKLLKDGQILSDPRKK